MRSMLNKPTMDGGFCSGRRQPGRSRHAAQAVDGTAPGRPCDREPETNSAREDATAHPGLQRAWTGIQGFSCSRISERRASSEAVLRGSAPRPRGAHRPGRAQDPEDRATATPAGAPRSRGASRTPAPTFGVGVWEMEAEFQQSPALLLASRAPSNASLGRWGGHAGAARVQ